MKINQISVNILLHILAIIFISSKSYYAQSETLTLKNQLNSSTGLKRIDILNNLAYEYKENYDSLTFFSQTALRYAEKANYAKGIGEAKGLLGLSYYLLKDYKKAQELFNSAGMILNDKDSPRILGMLYNSQGEIYAHENDKDQAKIEYLKALKLFQKSNALGEQAMVYSNLSRLDWIWSNYDDYINNNKKALEIRKKINDKKGMALNLNNLGAVHWQKAYYETSIRYYYEALRIREEIKDSAKMVLVLNNIGLAYTELGDLKNAIIFIKRALAISKKINDPYTAGYALNCLGKAYEKLDKFDSALVFFSNSLKYYQRSKDPAGIAFASMDIGRMHNSLKNPIQALKFFQSSLGHYQRIGNNKKLAEIYKNIGISNTLLKNYPAALKFFETSMLISTKIGQRSTLKDVYEQLTYLYQARGDYKKSLDYSLLFSKMKDSVSFDKYQKSVAEVQTKYQIERKNLELKNKEYELERQNLVLIISIVIILLLLAIIFVIYRYSRIKSKNNQELKQAYHELNLRTEELHNVIKTKDKFFSIIAHDLKNPFHNILSISEILYNDRDSLTREEEQSLINSLFQSSRDTYSLLENLLTWSLTQRKAMLIKKEKVFLREVVNSSLSTLSPSAIKKNILINSNVDNLQIECDRNALSTIIHNLVMNAIKFSYPDKEIEISAVSNAEHLYINIEDHGTGMTDEVKNNLFKLNADVSTKGTGNESGTGLGLIICKELVEMMEGKIKVETELNKGTRFTIVLDQKTSVI